MPLSLFPFAETAHTISVTRLWDEQDPLDPTPGGNWGYVVALPAMG
jgi:hypothetical protein